jgi:hypothetical protein
LAKLGFGCVARCRRFQLQEFLPWQRKIVGLRPDEAFDIRLNVLANSCPDVTLRLTPENFGKLTGPRSLNRLNADEPFRSLRCGSNTASLVVTMFFLLKRPRLAVFAASPLAVASQSGRCPPPPLPNLVGDSDPSADEHPAFGVISSADDLRRGATRGARPCFRQSPPVASLSRRTAARTREAQTADLPRSES